MVGSSGNAGLSKSLILKGMQCPKALYLAKNPPAFEFPPQPDLEAKYQAGNEVGILAQQLFPGGTEVPFYGLSVTQQIEQTRQLMDAGAHAIYEASFAFDGIFVKVDILIRDLMVPFCERDLYRWQMRGSYSIKAVLPALVPDLSYDGMDVADGMAAMRAYHEVCALVDPVALAELRRALLEYCRLDTLAMVRILDELESLN